MEKRRRDQRGDPPGKGTEGREGKRDKGKGLGAKKQQDSVGMKVLFTDSIHAPAHPQYPWGALCWCGDP